MTDNATTPVRFIGLDIHKHYFVATGINAQQEVVLGPQRVPNSRMQAFIQKRLTPYDALVIEMTTNTWEVHDLLVGHVHSVTVAHPPHVALIARAQVKTDKKDSLVLAQLLAAGLLPGVWIPPQEVRDLRALIAQRWKMITLRSVAKNRLHNVLHRHQWLPPEEGKLFSPDTRDWWVALPVSPAEASNIECDLATLDFADQQAKRIEAAIQQLAAEEERLPLLVQVPGISLITGMTILAAIGEIERFPSAKKLVGYAGLGARVSQSGTHYRTGRITKAGRKDLRHAMVEVARSASNTHPRWQAELERLEPRIGRKKAVVAIARKLLVAVWHILTHQQADRFASDWRVAAGLHLLAYKIGVRRLPEQSAKHFVRNQLDRLGIGADLTHVPWGTKQVKLPPSRLQTSEEGLPN
ncbi:MAG: IS110 family transposase [Anaerolineae bacterium]|nr:IS110 family transposase [Anaerolineae bacterium]